MTTTRKVYTFPFKVVILEYCFNDCLKITLRSHALTKQQSATCEVLIIHLARLLKFVRKTFNAIHITAE